VERALLARLPAAPKRTGRVPHFSRSVREVGKLPANNGRPDHAAPVLEPNVRWSLVMYSPASAIVTVN
jgi:hypothetical protein